MKLVKSLLLGSAAGLATIGAAQAADLPTRKAAPVEYVRVCDAYGAGFFYIPGTDTCLRVGGLVLAQLGIQPSTQLYSVAPPIGAPVGAVAPIPGFGAAAGALPGAAAYRSVNGREILGYNATGRIELDARTQSPWGTVRTFVRLTSQYGSSANYTTGSLHSALGLALANNTAGPTISKEVTYLDKAFIQFAGITAGRVQSFFDFYADAINYAPLRGSNQTAWAAAYTFTFGGGFSATASIEDTASHRGNVQSVIGAVPGVVGVGPAGFVGPTGVAALTGAARMPDIIANIRVDQPWGSAQISGAIHNIRTNVFAAPAATAALAGAPTAYAFPLVSSSSIGFAVQGGLQFNMDMLAPGDKLWLQATYAKGAISYVTGNNLAFVSGPSATANYGIGLLRLPNAVGWTNVADADCVWTFAGSCEKSSAFVVLAALKHYWTPTVSSGLFGDYYQITYSGNAMTPVSPYSGAAFTGMTNYREIRVGTNLVWTPIKNFDIGAEMTWMRGITSRPFGLASDANLAAVGLPTFKGTTDQFVGAIRMIRAF